MNGGEPDTWWGVSSHVSTMTGKLRYIVTVALVDRRMSMRYRRLDLTRDSSIEIEDRLPLPSATHHSPRGLH